MAGNQPVTKIGNPVLDYDGPEYPADEFRLRMYGGEVAAAKGRTAHASTTPAEATAAWSNSGMLAWASWQGDPKRIEFLEYLVAGGAVVAQRRVIRAERVGTIWPTIKCYLAREAEPTASGEFSPASL